MRVLNPLNVALGTWKVLWENPNVAENFPSQDIPIPDIERYNLFLVAANYSSAYPTATNSNIAYVPIGGPHVIIPAQVFSDSHLHYVLRYFSVHRDEKCINIDSGNYISANDIIVSDEFAIPRYILGAHI